METTEARRKFYLHELADFTWTQLEQQALPIKVRVDAEEMFPMLCQRDIICTINDFQYYFLAMKHCDAVGHRMKVSSDITPDHGTEHFYCRRCGWSQGFVWY